ncbi:hypothetical protein FACS1894141_3690 [Spirochaetia bacterium]|nr:hypothetical protein FACS1894141_3690 [Spirochaetia bacterium]
MMKKRFAIGLAALSAAALLFAACAFEPSGEDYKEDWNNLRFQADFSGGPKGLEFDSRTLDGGGGSYLQLGPNAAITITFRSQGGGGFSLNEAGVNAGISFWEVIDNGSDSAPDYNKPNTLAGTPIVKTVKSVTNNTVLLELNLSSVRHNRILLKIDAEQFTAEHGLKLNEDGDNKPGEPEDSYYESIPVHYGSLTAPSGWTTITSGSIPDPRGTIGFSGSGFTHDNTVSTGSGLVNGYRISVGGYTDDATEREAIRTFLANNLVIEKLAPGSRSVTSVTPTVTTDGAYNFKVTFSTVEGDIYTIKVKNLHSEITANRYNGYKLKGTVTNEASDEQILQAPRRVGFDGSWPVTAKSTWISLNDVFNGVTVESDNGKNYRIVLPLNRNSITGIGDKGLIAEASQFKIAKLADGDYPVYVDVAGVSYRTTTVPEGGVAKTVTTHVVLDLGGFNTLGGGAAVEAAAQLSGAAAVAQTAVTDARNAANNAKNAADDARNSASSFSWQDSAAYDAANAAYNAADDALNYANWADSALTSSNYSQARSYASQAVSYANTANTHANAAFTAAWNYISSYGYSSDANNVASYANDAASYANSAASYANSAASYANSAVAYANTYMSTAAQSGVSSKWRILISPAVKTALDNTAPYTGADEKPSRFVGNSGATVDRTNVYNEAPYYGWSVIPVNGGDVL